MGELVHIPVMADECIDGLNIKPDGIYVDGTIGGAGHSLLICQKLKNGRLIPVLGIVLVTTQILSIA